MKWVREQKIYTGYDTTVLSTEINENLQCKYSIKPEGGRLQEIADRDLSELYAGIEEFLRIHSGFEEVSENGLQAIP